MRQPPAIQRYRNAYAQRDLVHELEALIDRANPPLSTLDVDGWQLRTARGFTRTANSVWPRPTRGRLSLEARVAQVERFYGARRLAPAFLVSPSAAPRTLDRSLEAAGYTATPPVEVRTTRVDRLADLAGAAGTTPDAERWLEAWARAFGRPTETLVVAARVLAQVRAEQVFAVVEQDREAAVARGVVYGGWLGVDQLAATPGLRTRATGHALLSALGRWAAARDAEQAYCAVDTADPSRALLDGAGWRRAYTYRFRVHPLPPRPAGQTPAPRR